MGRHPVPALRFAALLLLITVVVAAGCQPARHRYQFDQHKMGAGFKIVMYAPSSAVANRAARAAYARVDELNAILSDYEDDSEINRLSRRTLNGPMTEPVIVSPELFHVLEQSIDVAKRTDGAFDVTVGPFSRLWRRSRDLGRLPTTQRIAEARASVGYRFIRLDPCHCTVQLLAPRMRLDVAGIAIGYIVDECLVTLRKTGIDRALIDAAGDVGVSGPPPGEKGWRIAIQSLQAPDESTGEYVELCNGAISTSGDTYRFVEIGGKRYSHILDPSTGLGLTERIGVTVIAPDGITSDWLDTAIAVMGREAGGRLVESIPGAAARFTTIEDHGRAIVSETSQFRHFVAPSATAR
jgi:FAD:protein FMN transferase